MRALFAIVLCPILLLTLQQAPLLHVHEKDHAIEHVTSQHRHGLGAHIHLPEHSSLSRGENGPGIEASDEDASAIAVSLFYSETPKAPIQYLVAGAFLVVDGATPAAVRVAPERPRIHDPPLHSSLIPRAPPA